MADPFDYGVNYLSSTLGLTPEQARGAVRWMSRVESGLNPSIVNPSSGAYGIGQWLGPRKQALFRNYGPSPSIEQQFAHTADELRGPEAGALRALRGAKTEDEAFRVWGSAFERPSPAEYAKATGGYKSGLRAPSGPSEGYYDSALHLTLRPEPEFPADAVLDTLLGSGDDTTKQPTGPLALLDSLMAQRPDEAKRASGGDTIEPPGLPSPAPNLLAEHAADLEPAKMQPISAALPQLPAAPAMQNRPAAPVGDTIEPLAMGQTAPPMPQMQKGVMEPAEHPTSLIDTLLKGAMSSIKAGGGEAAPGFARGVVRGAGAGFTGQPVEGEGKPPVASGAEAAGLIPGAVGGMLLSPLHTGGQALQAAMEGQPVAAQEMLTAGMAGVDPMGRLPGGVSRETPGVMQRLASSEQGAIPLPPQLVQGVKDAGKGIEKVFSPSTVDAFSEAGEALFRKEVGSARRSTERAEAQVGARGPLANRPAADFVEAAREPWRPLVQRYIPEFQAYIVAKKAGLSPPKPALLNFLDFVETRSQGTQYSGPPELRPLADIMRKLFKERELAIAAEPSTSGASFVEDYYAHQYRDPAGVTRAMGAAAGRQGTGRALKKRSIPTISDAIDMGFEPVTLDPVDMTMRNVANMDRYLAHNRIFRVGRDSGMIRYYPRGNQPDGWGPLEGRLAERAIAIHSQQNPQPRGVVIQAYAPDGFARIYNNSVALGFLHGELGGKAYTAALHAKNAITQSVLALSGYHALAMSQEASASAFASGIQALKAGDIREGLKQVGLGAIPGVKAGKDVFGIGRKMERQYRGIDDYGPDFERVADLYAKSGSRMVGRGAEYQGTSRQNYFTAFRRGQTRMELAAGLRDVGEGNPVYAPMRAVGFLAGELARINETITAPLFDKVVPRLKAAAFYDEMSEWLAQNPNATPDIQLRQAREFSDRMDDRFGELVMDNLFWAGRAKQGLQLAATSLGWEHGSIRSIGGAALDVLRGQFSPRVRYVIGLGMAVGLENAVYQYLKTGKTPGEGRGGVMSPGGALDMALPRTGGQTPEGAAERALLPGFEKDILGYMHDPVGELAGKLSPAGRLTVEAFTGRDYFGREIAPFPKYTPAWFKAYAGHVLQSMSPIPLRQEQLKGTSIGQAERFVGGNRPAPERWQNPMRQEKMETSSHIRALKGQLAGLYAHGVRTQQERKELDAKAKEIMGQIKSLQDDLQRHQREGRSSEYLYKPDRELRVPTSGP